MSDSTTLHYGLVKPEIDASKTTWGDKLNADLDTIDNTMFSIASAASSTAVLATPPAAPSDGMMWWESDTGYLFLRYNDGNSAQWVQLNGIPTAIQSNYVAKAGDTMTGPLIPAGGIVGVTDGSNALPGQVGEVISSSVNMGAAITANTVTVITSIVLTAGDWDVQGEVWVTVGTGAATSLQIGTSTSAAGLLGQPSIQTSRTTITSTMAASNTVMLGTKTARLSLTGTVTHYLLAVVAFPSGACTTGGALWARRAR